MTLGWIDPKDELPPLNEEVLVTMPDIVYGCWGYGVAKRIDDNHMQLSHDNNIIASIAGVGKMDKVFFIIRWAYNTNQGLDTKCGCYYCIGQDKIDIENTLTLAKEYAVSQGDGDGESFIKWIKANCGYLFGTLVYSTKGKGRSYDSNPKKEELYVFYKKDQSQIKS